MQNLKGGKTMKKRIEVKKGDRYGKLTIVKEIDPHVYPNGKKKRMFICRCDCDGKENAIGEYLIYRLN